MYKIYENMLQIKVNWLRNRQVTIVTIHNYTKICEVES